jgi:response regulator of citrate/malate metabolism
MRVFIVEDDEILLLMLNRMVERMGFDVVGNAGSGADAIRKILKSKPDLLLMDIILSDDIDGITVVETVKKRLKCPVIYITGNSDAAIRNRAKKFGYHDYLIKPTNYEALNKSIAGLTNGSKSKV